MEQMRDSGVAGTGLVFQFLPQLFNEMTFGRPLAVVFFLGLSFAAFSSYLALLNLMLKIGMEAGLRRPMVLLIMLVVCIGGSVPPSLSVDFLSNQDFVWGNGLIVCGLAVALLALKGGAREFRLSAINTNHEDNVGRWWDILVTYFIPIEGITLLIASIVKVRRVVRCSVFSVLIMAAYVCAGHHLLRVQLVQPVRPRVRRHLALPVGASHRHLSAGASLLQPGDPTSRRESGGLVRQRRGQARPGARGRRRRGSVRPRRRHPRRRRGRH